MSGPRMTYWNDNNEIIESEIIEQNGNLILVEDEQGNCDWITPSQVKELPYG